MSITLVRRLSVAVLATLLLSACERTPPDNRAPVTLPLYTQGNAKNGAVIFEEACGQCHQLQPGLNKKGPQLVNIYGADAAQLKDYDYSEGLINSGWVWDAKTLDPYIADVEKAIPDSKMLADPMPDASERNDVIAYLSTLRQDAPVAGKTNATIDSTSNTTKSADSNSNSATKMANEKSAKHTQMSNERVEVSADESQKPAADFQQ